MQQGWRRFAALAAAVGAIVVAFTSLQPGDDEVADRHRGQPPRATPPLPEAKSVGGGRPLLGGTRNDAIGPGSGRRILSYADGEVVGGVQTIEATRGEELTLAVTSDVPEKLHVHGADIAEDLPPADEVQIRFTPDAEGVFAIELHDSGTLLANLEVAPAP